MEKIYIKKLKIILNSNLFLLILIILVILKSIIFFNKSSIYNINNTEFIGIVDKIEFKNNTYKIILKSKENLLLTYNDNLNFNLGDKIKVTGKLNDVNNNTIFNQFNYKEYLLSKNIKYILEVENIEIIKENKNLLYKLKIFIISRINKLKYSEYYYSFILGDNYINSEIKNIYKINGIIHLFSISGMHVEFICGIIMFILNKIKKNKYNNIIVILILFIYMFLTNFTVSVVRAVLLFTFSYLNNIFDLKLQKIKIFLYVLLIALFINPFNIYNIGFKFSYIISFYLILYSKLISKHKNYFINSLLISIISFFSSLPILINNYFSVNLFSIINNLIFVPFVSFIIFPLSFFCFIFSKFSFLFSFFINVLEKLNIFMMYFKIEIIIRKINIIIIFIYYILMFLISLSLDKLKKLLFHFIFSFVLILIYILFLNKNYNFYVSFFDVGQGDSILIHSKYNNILIDIPTNKSTNIINYLKSDGIKKITYLVITHGDSDHIGGAVNLVENFNIENVILNCGEFNDLEKELIKVLNKENIKYYSCIKELNMYNYKIQFLNTKLYDNENDNSSVIYFNYNNYKFLFMGDASTEKEKDILDKYKLEDIDFLKVGHHGSDTSSSEYFIDSINPKYSLVSVGKNNIYGHPKKSVLDILTNINSIIYRTDIDGSIEVKIKSDRYSIETCKP